MRKLVGFVGAGAVAAGVLGGAIFATAGSTAPVAIQQVAETEDAAPALSCDTVRALDKAAVQARGVVPGPEQWPPPQPGFERDAPRPEPPIDPSTGKPKGEGSASLARSEISNSPDMGERPCGAVVEKIRAAVAASGGGTWICYLEDGRYASPVAVDAVKPIETREERDGLCRTLGYARSVQ